MSSQFNNNRWALMLVAFIAAGAMVVMTTGCETGNWDDPEYVAAMLEDGGAANQSRAVEELRNIEREDRDIVAESAAKLYLEERNMRPEVMRRLIEWRHPGAKDAYVEEMLEDHTGYGAAAARILGQLGLDEIADVMVEAYETSEDYERQIGILRGLSYIPDRDALPFAMEVLEWDVDNYPIRLHRAACEFIGSLAMVDPDAIDDEVRDRLVYARMLMSHDGRTTDEECGLAIQQVGFDIIPDLERMFLEEHDDIYRLMLTYDNPYGNEHFQSNEAKVVAAQHLTVMRAPEVVELYTEHLTTEIEEPDDLEGDSLREWRRNEAHTLNEMLKGLGDIGDPDGRSTLESVVQGEFFGDEWSVLVDGTVAFQMLQDSARALARLGDREARDVLLEMTGASIIPDMEARFNFMEEEKDSPVPLTEQLRPQWIAAKSFAYLGTSEDRGEIEELIDEIDDEDLEEKLESFLVAFDVMDECEDIGSESERAECFGGFLEHDSEIAREKAALELSRMTPDAAGPVVTEHLDTSDLDLRETLTFAGYRVPVPEMADRIQEIVESEAGQTSAEYQADHRRLRMLHAWLQHQDEDDVAVR